MEEEEKGRRREKMNTPNRNIDCTTPCDCESKYEKFAEELKQFKRVCFSSFHFT